MQSTRKRAVRIGRLTTVMEVAAEIGRIYRDARHEKIDAALGNRLASILSAMRQCLETAEFERRIAQIEAAVGRSIPTSSAVFDLTRRESPTDNLLGSDPAHRRQSH
jgi:hypothetical protein